ncbi:restriction endonuclease subunit R, partial [Candidatus Poribacteria bacterium]|nr:restriction endonuclease subunit R [Candidatus Poribacteria bacterium]
MPEVIFAIDVTLYDLETTFYLQAVEEPQFFPEWQNHLPPIHDSEKQLLDKLKAGYFNLIKYPPLLENIVQMAVLGPLLYLADFFLAPFHIKSEISVSVSDVDEGTTVEGKIDILVLKEHL